MSPAALGPFEGESRQRAERLQRALASACIGVWERDLRTDVAVWHGHGEALFGLAPGSFENRYAGFLDRVHPADRERVRVAAERAIAEDTDYALEFRIVWPDGTIRWLAVQGQVARDATGQARYLSGVSADVTARRQVERRQAVQLGVSTVLAGAAAAAEIVGQVLRTIGEQLGWVLGELWLPDRAASGLRCTQRWAAPDLTAPAFRASARELVVPAGRGLPGRVWASRRAEWIADLATHEDVGRGRLAAIEGLHAALAFPLAVEGQGTGVLVFVSRSAEAEDPALLETLTAIGGQLGQYLDRKRAEAEREVLLRREQEAREGLVAALQQVDAAHALVDTIFQSAPVGLGFWDRDLRFVRVNAALAEINGLSPEAHLGKTPSELPPGIVGIDEIERQFRRILTTGQPLLGMEVHGETPAAPGRTRYWRENWYPVRVRGEAVGIGAVVEEITAQREAAVERERLLASEQAARAAAESAVRARDEFLAIAAHELLTPVTSLKGHTQVLSRIQARGALDPVRLGQSLARIDDGATRLAQLIRDLLDVARLRTGRFTGRLEPLDLGAVVDQLVAAVRLELGPRHRLFGEHPPTRYTIVVDRDRLEQILRNLLDNAVKYSPDGGTIAVRVEREGDGVVVAVADPGIGLPPGAAEQIFEPFSRAANAAGRALPGMGLGLYICRLLAEQHGGRLWATSAGEGQGATFKLWLPLAEPAPRSRRGAGRARGPR